MPASFGCLLCPRRCVPVAAFLAVLLMLLSGLIGPTIGAPPFARVGGLPTPPVPRDFVGGSPLGSPQPAGLARAGLEPAGATFFTLTLVANPSRCTVLVDGYIWGSGHSNSTVAYGYHTIQANFCSGEALTSWESTAGPTTGTDLSPTYLFVQANGTLTANFTVGYNVTFNETGLFLGTPWTVELEGSNISSSTYTVEYQKPNGTFSYTIAPFAEYAAKYSGTVQVAGSDVTIQVLFTPIVFPVTFLATGLPSETTWVVTLNNSTTHAKTTYMGFSELNGTYSYEVWQPPGFHSNITEGQVKIAGGPSTIYVGFSQNSSSPSIFPPWGIFALAGAIAAAIALTAAVVFIRRGRSRPPKP